MSKILMLTATLAAALTLQVRSAQAETPLLDADLAPKYTVGVVPNFIRDFNQTFDAWGQEIQVRRLPGISEKDRSRRSASHDLHADFF